MSEQSEHPLPPDDAGRPRQAEDEAQAVASSSLAGYLRGSRKRDVAKDAAVAAAKGAIAVARELTTKREDGVLPGAVSDFIHELESSGGDAVERMVAVRTPVQAYVGELMQMVSFGKYREVIARSYYDQMFHLSLLINGRYILQKNEVIDLRDAGGPKEAVAEGSDFMAVRIPTKAEPPLTFGLLLENTKQHMGARAFSNYCAKTNNCQDFILAVLEGNGLAHPHLVSFIKQDSEAIFSQLPIHATPVARALTNVAAVADKVKEDVVAKHQETDYGGLAASVEREGAAMLQMAGSLVRGGASKGTKSAGKGGSEKK